MLHPLSRRLGQERPAKPQRGHHSCKARIKSRHLINLTPDSFGGFVADRARDACRVSENLGPVPESPARHNPSCTGPLLRGRVFLTWAPRRLDAGSARGDPKARSADAFRILIAGANIRMR